MHADKDEETDKDTTSRSGDGNAKETSINSTSEEVYYMEKTTSLSPILNCTYMMSVKQNDDCITLGNVDMIRAEARVARARGGTR